MIIYILMGIITVILMYGVAWALFSATATKFNTMWGKPDNSWRGLGTNAYTTIKLDNWDLAEIKKVQEPLKITAETSTKVITQENRKTLGYNKLTTAQANELKNHMKSFKAKKEAAAVPAFDPEDTLEDDIPYWGYCAKENIPKPLGKRGNKV